ncbi:MAG: hypothetical protein ACR2NL_04845 [Acidimicrobiia bacterium]
MATTRESIADLFRWCLEVLKTFTRRAIIFGVFAGLFAVAVIYTTRERVSECRDVTDGQRALLQSLGEPGPDRSFFAVGVAGCEQGLYSAPLEGVAETMEGATAQLIADGWSLEAEFVPFFDHLWRRCFSLGQPGWERVQITVDALRSGSVKTVQATALENVNACEREQR